MSPQIDETKLALNRSGVWEIRWTERRDGDPRGYSRTYSCRTKDRREAEAVRSAWLAAGAVLETHSSDFTVNELLDAYVTGHIDANRKGDGQKYILRRVREILGSLALGELTARRALQYAEARRAEGRKDGAVRRELGALTAALRWCLKNEILPHGTVLPHIPLPASGPARTNYLSVSEEKRMFALAADKATRGGRGWRIGLFICLALDTAARARAIETLTWSRVDLKRGVIDYRDSTRAVSKKRRVPVPISDRLRPVLEFCYARQSLGPVIGTTSTTRHGFNDFCERHGFVATRHDLRRTWATLAAQAGVDMFSIAGVLGDTVETVTKHYAHHSPEHLRAAVNWRTNAASA